MEWIFIGIAIAIGFYFAPIVITFVLAIIVGFFTILGIIWDKVTGNSRKY